MNQIIFFSQKKKESTGFVSFLGKDSTDFFLRNGKSFVAQLS
jgi:hypothetical protein